MSDDGSLDRGAVGEMCTEGIGRKQEGRGDCLNKKTQPFVSQAEGLQSTRKREKTVS